MCHLSGRGPSLEVRHNHGNVAAKFPDQLTACAAGGRQRVGVSYHGNGVEAAFAFADGFEDGDALGANGEAVSAIFNAATPKDSPATAPPPAPPANSRLRPIPLL